MGYKTEKQSDVKRQSLEAGILLAFAVVVIGLVGSLFIFESQEAKRMIWPSLIGALFGLATFCGYVSFGRSGTDPDSPTVVASLPDEMSASAVVVQLEAHGVSARAVGGYTSGFQTEIASDVKVVVAARDKGTALAVLNESLESGV